MLISADFETIQNTIASLYFFKNPHKKNSALQIQEQIGKLIGF